MKIRDVSSHIPERLGGSERTPLPVASAKTGHIALGSAPSKPNGSKIAGGERVPEEHVGRVRPGIQGFSSPD